MKKRTFHWSDLTTQDFADLDMTNMVAIQQVAAVEQHGPHLPVIVDAAINDGIVKKALTLLPSDAPVLVLPPLNVGKSNEHLAYPGTLNISYETLCKVWLDIGESVQRAGCQRIIYFNSHGGQPQLVEIVCRELRVRFNMLAIACNWYDIISMDDLFDKRELTHGIHGGAVETSIMLHLHPELVRMEKAQDFVSAAIEIEANHKVLRSEGQVGMGWQMQDLHPAGACGNALAANPKLGHELVERAAAALATLLMETAHFQRSKSLPLSRASK